MNQVLQRKLLTDRLDTALERSPITALLGPRQCGKTTLAKGFAKTRASAFFDLESPVDLRRLENPEMVLGSLEGLVVLDEIQAVPELFTVLRVLADRMEGRARFLILGSASPHMVRRASESLAGRVEFLEMAGFDLAETGPGTLDTLWLRGGFPRSFLADSEDASLAWREGFVRTFLERDIPQLGIRILPAALRRFWAMLAHYHGQTWNASELGRSMGLTYHTIRDYLDILTGTFMVRQLQPWFENYGKRQVKAPKVYFRDSGVLHHLLEIPSRHALLGHPKVGASWEGFALEQVLRLFESAQPYYWSTHGGIELDLLLQHNGRRLGFEFKFSEAPRCTVSMRRSAELLELDSLFVVHPGVHRYPMAHGIEAVPLAEAATLA